MNVLERYPMKAKLNLIQFNAHAGSPGMHATSADEVRAFQAALRARGVSATVRISRGDDEMAACGLLGNVEAKRREEEIATASKAKAAGDNESASWSWPSPPRLQPPARLEEAVKGWDEEVKAAA